MSDLERQRWLAGLALVVAFPLPLTGVTAWPFVLPYVLTAGWMLLRSRAVGGLPTWMENLLAPAVLAVVVAAGGLRFGVLRPIAHLALLVAAIRLPGSGAPRRAPLTLVVAAIIGVAGIASSTHPSLLAYLMALLAFVVVGAGRLTILQLRGAEPPQAGRSGWPPVRLVVLTVVMAALMAVPLFAVLPRLRSPLAGSPIGGGSSGFRSDVTLHGIGTIKLSQRIALTVRFPGVAAPSPEWLRLEGATLSHYRAGSWVEGRHSRAVTLTTRGGPFALWPRDAELTTERAEVTIEKPGRSLFLPPGAVNLVPTAGLEVSRTPEGVLRIPADTPVPLDYEVEFQPRRLRTAPIGAADLEVPRRVRERLAPLVEEVTFNAGNHLALALAIEQHLQTGYTYSLQTSAPLREDPVIWFLFRSQAGHCEFFASAMALMLRVAGVPARVQVGFAGGESRPDGSFVVRDSRAHAWVIAWVNGGWRVFDPTPPEGQPTVAAEPWQARLPWTWEDVEAGWNRWILTFTMLDQAEGLRVVLAWLATHGHQLWAGMAWAALLGALLVLWRWRSRAGKPRVARRGERGDPMVRAIERVALQARRQGLEVADSLSPRALQQLLAASFPLAGEALAWLVVAHERQRYAGGPPVSRREVRRHLGLALHAMGRPSPTR